MDNMLTKLQIMMIPVKHDQSDNTANNITRQVPQCKNTP